MNFFVQVRFNNARMFLLYRLTVRRGADEEFIWIGGLLTKDHECLLGQKHRNIIETVSSYR